MNLIKNPGFSDLDFWTLAGNAAFAAAKGNDQLGACSLPDAGSAISQQVILPDRPHWTVWASFYSEASGNVDVTITNLDGDTVYSATIALDGDSDWDAWQPDNLGLPPGTHTIRFAYNSAAVWLDDVSLAHIPKTRVRLAQMAHEDVAALSDDIDDFTPPSSGNEGSYTKSLDAALYYVGAINHQGHPDVRWLHPEMVDAVIGKVVEDVLTGPVLAYYQKKTDFTQGPRSESFSQIANGIRQRYGLVPGATHSGKRRMMVIDMTH